MSPDDKYCPSCASPLEEKEAAGRQRPVCPNCGRVVFYDPKVAATCIVERGEQVLLVNVDGTIHGCDDVCTHSYASLSEGDLDGAEIQCPLHGAMFNVVSGDVITPPAEEALRSFEVRIEGDDILVGPPKS